MMKLMSDKRGGEKYLSIWWFFVLAVIVGGIVIGVSAFNVADIDVKEIEADILANRVIDCVINNGYINEDFLNKNFDVFEKCYLNREIVDVKEDMAGEHYLEINVYNFEDCSFGNEKSLKCVNPINSQDYGVNSIKTQCESQKAKKRYYPGGSGKYVYVLSGERKMMLYVYAGSRQLSKRELK